jgi:hypothetical protein
MIASNVPPIIRSANTRPIHGSTGGDNGRTRRINSAVSTCQSQYATSAASLSRIHFGGASLGRRTAVGLLIGRGSRPHHYR